MRMSLGEKWATMLALMSVAVVQRFGLGGKAGYNNIESSEALPMETDSFWYQVFGSSKVRMVSKTVLL